MVDIPDKKVIGKDIPQGDDKKRIVVDHPDLSHDGINTQNTLEDLRKLNTDLLDQTHRNSDPIIKKIARKEAEEVNKKLLDLRNQIESSRNEPIGHSNN